MRDELKQLEEAALRLAPPEAIVTGSAISPDRRYGVVRTILPSPGDYPMEDIFERAGEHWVARGGGGGAQVAWSSLDDALGVLRFADGAPSGAETAMIAYEGREYRVPVRQGRFFFVAWDTAYTQEPHLLGFE